MRKLTVALAGLALINTGPVLADNVEDAVASGERPEADRALDAGRMPVEILRFADIQEGETVADFMAGGGYYTALIAKLVGKKGAVYALNPAPFHSPEVWQARVASHSNIRPIATANRAMVLPPDSVDTIFTHLTFHDIYWESERFQFEPIDEQALLANWFAALKPGGLVIIVDHMGPGGDPRDVTERLHRIAPETVLQVMTQAGFELVEQSDVLRRNDDDISVSVFDDAVRGKTDRFVMKFRKPAR
jgi:predicted methyltransferase